MFQVFNLSKYFSGKPLFEDISFSVGDREIIGLVGKNGSGKTTLFKIILGQEPYDEGKVVFPKGYTLGYLDQHIHFTKPTVLEECCQVLSEEEQYDFYKAEKILSGLGFSNEDFYRSPLEFSGGFQLRINLTKSLLKKPNLMLLDEPTNYLDIVSIRWLRRFLKSFPGEVILTTHDRYFMDSVTTHTMGFKRGQLRKVEGSTEKFYQQIAVDEEVQEKTRIGQEKKIEQLQAFVDRFGAKASKASQAQSKVKLIEKLRPAVALAKERTLGFRFNYKPIPGKTLLTVENLAFSYTGNIKDALFQNLSFQINSKDRLAVIGKNGKGKTTLLNVLSQEAKPTVGNLKFHPEASIGYYQQTNKKNLNPNNTVIDEISNSNPNLMYSEVRAICGAMMFTGDTAKKKISVLSGGEQSRVLLGKILAHPANLLLLDEPSNHLDMESVEALTEEIDKFPGGVVIVTHNEEMLRKLANKLIIFRKDKAELFLGNYDEFLEKIGWDEEETTKTSKPKTEIKKNESEKCNSKFRNANKLKNLKKEIQTIESKIIELETILESKNSLVTGLINDGLEGIKINELYKEIAFIQEDIDSNYKKMDELNKSINEIE